MPVTISSVEEYIRKFSPEIQERLKKIRLLILSAAPGAEEGIAYGMPAYKINKKPLVYFGGFEKHIGFYATPSGHEAFKQALSGYKQGKGSVQFPHAEPLPEQLITDITAFRVAENSGKI